MSAVAPTIDAADLAAKAKDAMSGLTLGIELLQADADVAREERSQAIALLHEAVRSPAATADLSGLSVEQLQAVVARRARLRREAGK